MTFLFYIVLCFLVLQFVKESNEKIFSIVAIAMFFVMLQLFIAKVWMPFITLVQTQFHQVPAISLLIASAMLIFLGEFCVQLFDQFEMKPLQLLVKYAVGISISILWFNQLQPYIAIIEQYIVKVPTFQ